MECINMSHAELDRVEVIARVLRGSLRQTEAARVLGLSTRQVRRLSRRMEQGGAAALASRRRGRPSNNRLPDALRRRAVGLVRTHYHDFGPTFAQEKLVERHGLQVSVETLRKWMIDEGIWVPRKLREQRPQRPRRRRPCRGELVQIDGSDHEWFEERGPRCALLVFIDDATSAILALHFCESEDNDGKPIDRMTLSR